MYRAEVISHDRIKVGCEGARLVIDDAPDRTASLAVGIRIECSSGTYIRSIARDLGEAVGSGAMLIGLLRAAVGPFTLANASEVWQIDTAALHGYLDRLLFPPDAAVEALPAHIAGDQLRLDLIHGRPAPRPPGGSGRTASMTRMVSSLASRARRTGGGRQAASSHMTHEPPHGHRRNIHSSRP